MVSVVRVLTLVVVHLQDHPREEREDDQWGAFGRVRGSPHTQWAVRRLTTRCCSGTGENLPVLSKKHRMHTHKHVASDD